MAYIPTIFREYTRMMKEDGIIEDDNEYLDNAFSDPQEGTQGEKEMWLKVVADGVKFLGLETH